ncbi:Fur family transcriptional regulator [Vibrio maerlii]|uniref:Fur family transcriptional regulator n=1 Tax=Vibrio maerlii TaxID=2231648 RepID=UPI003B848362
MTSTRRVVLGSLLHAKKPLSAYELMDYCASTFEHSLQAMSVYRALEFLESEHLVHKLNTSNKFVACSHIAQSHEHGVAQFLICSKCDKIAEQQIDPILIDALTKHARKQGFTLIQPQLEIECICDACK